MTHGEGSINTSVFSPPLCPLQHPTLCIKTWGPVTCQGRCSLLPEAQCPAGTPSPNQTLAQGLFVFSQSWGSQVPSSPPALLFRSISSIPQSLSVMPTSIIEFCHWLEGSLEVSPSTLSYLLASGDPSLIPQTLTFM